LTLLSSGSYVKYVNKMEQRVAGSTTSRGSRSSSKRRGPGPQRGARKISAKASSRSLRTKSGRTAAKTALGKPAAAARTSERPLVRAFLDRVGDYLHGFASRTPDPVLARALSEPTPVGTIARALTEQTPAEQALGQEDHAIAAALARGAKLKEELLRQAGGVYSGKQIGDLLGITTRQGVAVARQSGRLLGVPTRSGPGKAAYVYPKAQFTRSGVVPGLQEFLNAFTLEDPWAQLAVLLSPSPRLEGWSPLQALRAGRIEDAVAVAAAYGEHGA
jgi:hypothetical protein